MRSIVEIIQEVRKLQAIVTTLNERITLLETRQAPETYIEAIGKPLEDQREKIKARWLKRNKKG